VIRIVKQTKQRSGWPAHRTLAALGVPRSVYYGWLRRESLEDRPGAPCRVYEALAEERAAICEFALRYPKIGYRKLTWMMVDAQVVCVGESTVYRVLSEANLLSRWKRSERSRCLLMSAAIRAFAVSENCRSGAKQVIVPGCTLPGARTARPNYIPLVGGGQNTCQVRMRYPARLA